MYRAPICFLAILFILSGKAWAQSLGDLEWTRELIDPSIQFRITTSMTSGELAKTKAEKQEIKGTNITVETIDLTRALHIKSQNSPRLGQAYGKIVLKLAAPKIPAGTSSDDRDEITKHPFKFVMADVIRGMFGKKSGNYMATVTVRNPTETDPSKSDITKMVAASASWEETKFLWITTDSKYSSSTIFTAVILRGLLVDNKTNNVRTVVQVANTDKFAMDVESAQSFFSLVHKTQLVGNVDPLADGLLKSFLGLANKILGSSTARDITEIKEMQFIRVDELETVHAFNIKGVYDGIAYSIPGTITLQTDLSLFPNFDGQKFVAPIPEQIERDSLHLIIGKTGWDYLAESSDPKIKQWAADTQAAKIPTEEKSVPCGDIYGKLLRVYTTHDAAALYWAALKKLQSHSDKEALKKYMERCMANGKKELLDGYGLTF